MKNSCTRKKYNISKIKLLLSQITLFIMLIIIWELLAHFNIINTFLFSKPSDIMSLMYDYFRTNEIYKHIYISLIAIVSKLFFWWRCRGSNPGIKAHPFGFLHVILFSSRTIIISSVNKQKEI